MRGLLISEDLVNVLRIVLAFVAGCYVSSLL